MNAKITIGWLFAISTGCSLGCAPEAGDIPESMVAQNTSALVPALTGRVAFHKYRAYGDGSSQLYVLHLGTRALTPLSRGWTNVKDCMNAHFSPDGKKLVFMAKPYAGGVMSAYWNLYTYAFASGGNPVALTTTAAVHEEDPKWSPDGLRVVYKVRPQVLRQITVATKVATTIIGTGSSERSMPFYDAAGTSVWYSLRPAGGTAEQESIRKVNVDGNGDSLVIDSVGMKDYYPVRDTVGQFLWTRAISATDKHDQIYMYDGVAPGTRLAINGADDFSDACPIGTSYIVYSTTAGGRSSGRWDYDLYVANRATGAAFPLGAYNPGVNTSEQELGASYTATSN